MVRSLFQSNMQCLSRAGANSRRAVGCSPKTTDPDNIGLKVVLQSRDNRQGEGEVCEGEERRI